MVFAAVFPQIVMRTEQTEALGFQRQVLVKGATSVCLVALFAWWVLVIFQKPKLEYNQVHPYFFYLPMLMYLYLRNLTPWLRGAHLGLWAEIGKITLETYLLQHHIWLTSNAKTVLVWIPWSPKLNMALTTVVYVFCSRRLYRLTLSLRAMLLPTEPLPLLIWLAVLFGVMGASFVFAGLLEFIGVGVFGIGLGVLASGLIIVGAAYLVHGTQASLSAARRGVVLVVCLALAVGGGLVWINQVDPFPPVPPPPALSANDCIPLVNDGVWVNNPELCQPSGSFALCTPRIWKWSTTASSSCGYSRVAKVSPGKMQFWGGNNVRGVFLSIARLTNPSVAYPAKNNGKVEVLGDLEYHPGTFQLDGSPSVIVLEDAPSSLTTGIPVYFMGDVVQKPLYASAAIDFAKVAQTANPSDILAPGSYAEVVYDVGAQILLNAARGPVLPSPSSSTSGTASKGSGGGVAHDPALGAMVIAFTLVMLYAMDGYLGLAAVFNVLGQNKDQPRVTWAASVAKLHEQIGIMAKSTTPASDVDLEQIPLKTEEKS